MTPDAERWQAVDRLFSAALERPVAGRAAFVHGASKGDEALCEEVLELLAASTDDAFLASPDDQQSLQGMLAEAASGAAGQGNKGAVDPLLGATLGAYRIERALAHGGMGTVYLGERTEGFTQQVAIKTLRRGIDTDEVVQRFLAERQILARLVHPNIAKLFDGGATPDGRPYFVMEYVNGLPITDYADQARLGIEARLDLFQTVAGALQYAHQHLVVHRDLKPSNVFVSHDGVVKLLDFGIARLVGSEHQWGQTKTSTGFRVLTPAYAAPEQVSREPVTTATDVYQLGALFYELMSGVRPFPKDLPEAELEQCIVARDPEPLSKVVLSRGSDRASARGYVSSKELAHRLRGDLDVIADTALAKEPGRRYGTVEGMATDVRRHLSGRPIAARPPTLGYQLNRFVRRNRWVVPTSVAALAALVLYVGTLNRHNRRLALERDRAEAVTEFVTGLFNSPNPWTDGEGADVTVLEALEAGVQRVETDFTDRPDIRARLLEVIGSSYYWLNRSERAHQVQARAVALRDELSGPSAIESMRARHMLGLTTGAVHGSDSALAIMLPLVDELEGQAEYEARALYAEVLGSVAWTYWKKPDFEAALRYFASADAAFQQLDPPKPVIHGEVLRHYSRAIGQADATSAEAMTTIQRSVALLEDALPDDDINLAAARQDLGSALSNAGEYDASLDALHLAAAAFEEQLEPNDPNLLAVRNNIGFALMAAERLEEAEAAYREVVALYETRESRSKGHGDAIQNLAVAVERQGRIDEAIDLSLTAYEVYREVLGEHYVTAFPLLTISGIELDRGRYADALDHLETAYPILERTLPDGHFIRSVVQCRRGHARWAVGDRLGGRADVEIAAKQLGDDPRPYAQDCRDALAMVEGSET